MKVAIDITHLHADALSRGVGYYANNLFLALQDLKDGNAYSLINKGRDQCDADIIHYPYFDPVFLTLPLFNKKPTIITVHDLTQVKFSEHYPRGIRGEIKWQIQQRLLRQANAIITDSLNSMKDIQKIINYPKAKIYPIYLACDTRFKKLSTGSRDEIINNKYHLPKTFLLYVGDINWNKNVKGLIEAFQKLKINPPAGGNNLKLILVGSAFQNKILNEQQELMLLINNLKLYQDIMCLGYVSDNELSAIYSLATLYIQPSFYEGFGLPILEAMSCGCPILSSDQGSLPEIGGKAVEYFDPRKPEELYNKLINLLGNKERLQNLKISGLKQAAKFSWEKTAKLTTQVYEKIF